jgi:hypothetical protein
VAHCGTVTTALSVEYIYCNGSYGDMVYLTDLDTEDCCGLNIAEVEVYASGKQIIYSNLALENEITVLIPRACEWY